MNNITVIQNKVSSNICALDFKEENEIKYLKSIESNIK